MNKKQGKWTLNEIDKINQKYKLKVPFNQRTWDEFREDVNNLYDKSKNNEDVKIVLIQLVVFYDLLHARIKEEK